MGIPGPAAVREFIILDSSEFIVLDPQIRLDDFKRNKSVSA
jgi:hypothetical protein